MHIRRLVVHRYGPLPPFDGELSDFTVIHGPNEKGKTLLIDALVRILFKDEIKRGHYKLFGNLSRVDERPEGFAVVATHAEETTVGADRTLSSVAPVPITPEDFRNVFLIRDSDLSLKNESAYYERVSERLCGTRSSAIDGLKEALKRIGRLRSATPDSVLSARKDKKDKRVAEQLAAAEHMLDEIRALAETLRGQGFDDATRRLADLADERARLEAESRRLREAERRTRLEKAREAVAGVRERMTAAAELARASDAHLEAWRGIVAQRGVLERDVADLATRRSELAGAFEEARAAGELLSARDAEQASRRDRVEAQIRPVLDAWLRESGLRRHADRGTRAIAGALVVSIAVGVGAAIAGVVTRSPFAAGAAAAGALSALVCGVVLWKGARSRAALARGEMDLVAAVNRLGLAAESAGEIADVLAEVQRDAELSAERAREQESVVRQREHDVEACDAHAEERRQLLAQLDRDEAALRDASGFDTLETLSTAAARRHELETGIAEEIAALRSLLPGVVAVRDNDALLAACEREIERGLATTAAAAESHGTADPDAVRAIDGDLERVASEETALRQQLERSREELSGIAIRVSQLHVIDGPAHCRTTRELDDVYARVMTFCEDVRRKQRLAQEAIRILDEIDAEEQEKVGALFGADSPVSRWFHDVTGGRYRAVFLEDGDVEVESTDGRRLSASALSGGAFDQLYLAIRASIAERMLPDTRGFFILDDPFLKADRTRLRSLMKMVRQLVSRGWQVIYVTAKDEVVDALDADIAAGRVRLIDLDRTLFSRAGSHPAGPGDAPRLF